VDGAGSGLCPMAGIGISGIELCNSASRQIISKEILDGFLNF
jgi:hypothetical protein